MIESNYGAAKTADILIERWQRLAQEYREESARLKADDPPEIGVVLRAWAQARENCAMELRQEIDG